MYALQNIDKMLARKIDLNNIYSYHCILLLFTRQEILHFLEYGNRADTPARDLQKLQNGVLLGRDEFKVFEKQLKRKLL